LFITIQLFSPDILSFDLGNGLLILREFLMLMSSKIDKG